MRPRHFVCRICFNGVNIPEILKWPHVFAGSRGSVCSLFCFDVIQMVLIVDNSIVDMPVGIGRLQKSLQLYSLFLSRTLFHY